MSMNNKIYLVIVFLLSLGLFSCSDKTKEHSSLLANNDTRNIITEDGVSIEDLEERNVYIDENYESFEGIRIFDSSEDLFYTLSELEAMNYTSLKAWCEINSFYSPILESRIIYDSVFSDILEEFGYNYDDYVNDQNYIIDSEDVFETFKEHMIREHSNHINIFEEYDEEYGNEYYIEPFSTDGFDELIFMNNKNIVIIGLNVYKLVENLLLSTSVYNFNAEFANLMSPEAVYRYLSSENTTENVYLSHIGSNSNTEDILPIKREEKGNRTKMKVKLKAFDSPNWKGVIIRHARLIVNNYKYGCWKRVYTTINVSAHIKNCDNYNNDDSVNNSYLFRAEGKFYKKTCKAKKAIPFGFDRICLYNITGSIENNWGLSINF